MLNNNELLPNLLHVRKRRLTAALIAVVLLILATTYALIFSVPKKVIFSYAGTTCTPQLTLLPGVMKSDDKSFGVSHQQIINVGSNSLASLEICFKPKAVPVEGLRSVAVSPWAGIFAKKTFQLEVPRPPIVSAEVFANPLPTSKPLIVSLSAADTVHSYRLVANHKQTDCTPTSKTLACDVAALKFKQDAQYDIKLERRWRNESAATLIDKKVKTLPATKLINADLKDKQTLYTRQKDFSFRFDKEIVKASVKIEKVEDEKASLVSSKVAIEGKKVIVKIDEEFDRSQSYRIVIKDLEAKDGSSLTNTYEARFYVSGGPKLIGRNIGSTGAGLSQTVTLTFDQPLRESQDVKQFVQVKGLNASVRKAGNSVYVQYDGASKCRDFSITIVKGIESQHKVKQQQPQTVSSRTVCYTISTIGFSHEGRPINAYYFGNGTKTILFTGAIHGSEASSYETMNSWVRELDTNARQIPDGKQVVVIPMMSPDGYYKYGRFNAKKVNLNRNWPTDNWKKDGGAGGPKPLSEPETKALANLTQQLGPSFVATYHAQGRIVNSNDVSSSLRLGQNYAATVGYRFVPDAQTVEVFGEMITGTYEDWLKARGTPCILMELDSLGGDYFYSHKSAMWSLVKSY